MGTKISALTELAATPDVADVVPIVDVSTGLTKKITIANLVGGGGGVPSTRLLTAGTGLTGGGDLSADRSFAVDIAATSPLPVGTPSAGSSGKVSDRDHVHYHGTLTDEDLHALATKDTHGFVHSADYDMRLGSSKKRALLWRTDCEEPYTSNFAASVSGTAAAVNHVAIGPSAYLINPGTTATGACTLRSTCNQTYTASSTYAGRAIEVYGGLQDALPDGSNNYYCILAAFLDSGLATSGMGFIYDHTISANWQAFVLAAGVFTYIDTGIAAVGSVGPAAYTRFRTDLVGGTTAGTVNFYIDEVLVGSQAGGLTTVAAGYTVPVRMVKTLGTNTRRFALDFTECSATPAAERN